MNEDDQRPGPDPLARLSRVHAGAPPMLAVALGYSGAARFVAFYWVGDHLVLVDGRLSTSAEWAAWHVFTTHPSVEPALRSFSFAGDWEDAPHWLLIDRFEEALYAGPAPLVRAVVSEQHPRPDARATGHERGEAPELDLELFTARMREVAAPSRAEVLEALGERNRLLAELRAWLDAAGEPPARPS